MTVVTVDAFHLDEASGNRGIGTYQRELLRRLPARDLDVQALVQRPTSLPDGVRPRPIHRRAPGRFRALEHELRLPFDLRRAGGDVVWSPAQDPPHRSAAPFVQTLFDVTPLRFGSPRDPVARRMRRLAPRYRAAARWIAISRYTAATTAEAFGLPLDRIEVAHLGVDARFSPASDRRDGEPYVLYVGEYGAHKGFAEAFAVVAGLADAGFPHRLRMVGRLAPWWRPEVERLLASSPCPDRVDLVGYVDDVVAEYRSADVLVCTSRHEGFGLPVAEAMACGTPVVSFDNSSLPEVVADGGVLVPDGDVSAMVGAVAGLLRSTAARDDASGRALVRAKAFDWEATADVHADVLRAAAR